MIGGVGDDRLTDGLGDDILSDGGGIDVMTGGAGADTFVFATGRDRITDFDIGQDRLAFESALWDGRLIPADMLFLHETLVGTDTVLDFGDGQSLTLDHVTDLTALANRIDFI